MDAGHWITSARNGTKFVETNVHAQCRSCNRDNAGEKQAHRIHIENKYGMAAKDWLIIKAKTPMKFTDSELTEMIEHYKRFVKSDSRYK